MTGAAQIACLLLGLALRGPGEPAPATPQRAQAVERMIDDGKLKAAETALAKEAFAPLALASLRGRLALAKGDAAAAVKHFKSAVALAPDHAPLRLLLAHALLRASRYAKVAAALDHPDIDPRDPAVALLLGAAHEANGEHALAYAALTTAADAHPKQVPLRQQLALLCAREGLLEATRTWSQSVSPAQLGREVALALMAETRGDRPALRLARELAAGFPDDADVQTQLGWSASAAGRTEEASRAFARAVRLGADEAYAAAEHARAAGRHADALRMNARVGNAKKRASQRLDIIFESGALARSIVVAEALEASAGLSTRQQYNLAYAHYTLQQYGEASRRARDLAGTDQAKRAAKLLRAMGR